MTRKTKVQTTPGHWPALCTCTAPGTCFPHGWVAATDGSLVGCAYHLHHDQIDPWKVTVEGADQTVAIQDNA